MIVNLCDSCLNRCQLFIGFKLFIFFFLNDPAPPEFYPFPLPDALPISIPARRRFSVLGSRLRRSMGGVGWAAMAQKHVRLRLDSAHEFPVARHVHAIRLSPPGMGRSRSDRKSTRLNPSHSQISYAVFCL